MRPSRITGGLSVGVLAALAVLVVWTIIVFTVEDRSMAIRKLGDETTRLASTLFFGKMTAIAQLSVGLLGASWAFLTLTDSQVEMKERDAIICFTVANAAFGVSLLIYAFGYDFIVTRIFHHLTFDIDAPFVSQVSAIQQLTFICGCVSLVLAVLFGRKP